MIATLLLSLFVAQSQALFFGSGGGGGCGCSQPAPCQAPPPPPVCAPPPAPICPQPSPCGAAAYAAPIFAAAPAPVFAAPPAVQYQPQYQPQPLPPVGGYASSPVRAVVRRNVDNEEQEVANAFHDFNKRVKREEQTFDPKCNSEILKQIIIDNMKETTAASKREIQLAATEKIGGRIDVICSSGTFSYIVNTELYCETEKNGTTCFAFRQSA